MFGENWLKQYFWSDEIFCLALIFIMKLRELLDIFVTQ